MKQFIIFIKITLFCLPIYSLADEYKTYDGSWAAKYAIANYNQSYNTNPFDDYENVEVGGNCTNFVSQSIIAGLIKSSSMQNVYNNRKNFDIDHTCYSKFVDGKQDGCPLAWYYHDKTSQKSRGPAWTSAHKLYEYAKHNKSTYEGLHFEPITHDTLDKFMEYDKIKIGDVIFADWEHDNIIDHSMIVTNIQSWRLGYNEIRVTYQSQNKTDRGLGDINESYKDNNGRFQALFYVYRPINYDPKENIHSSAPTLEEMADFVFNKIESKYTNFFSPHTSSQTSGEYYYRYYPNDSYLLKWNNNLWYNIKGSGWQDAGLIVDWYNSFK